MIAICWVDSTLCTVKSWQSNSPTSSLPSFNQYTFSNCYRQIEKKELEVREACLKTNDMVYRFLRIGDDSQQHSPGRLFLEPASDIIHFINRAKCHWQVHFPHFYTVEAIYEQIIGSSKPGRLLALLRSRRCQAKWLRHDTKMLLDLAASKHSTYITY